MDDKEVTFLSSQYEHKVRQVEESTKLYFQAIFILGARRLPRGFQSSGLSAGQVQIAIQVEGSPGRFLNYRVPGGSSVYHVGLASLLPHLGQPSCMGGDLWCKHSLAAGDFDLHSCLS
jgi:hypothetical protein